MAEAGVSVDSRTRNAVREDYDRPPRFRVIMYNDNYTTMEFVVYVLVTVFHWDFVTAESLMWTIHRSGQAVVGIYPRELAESRCEKAMMLARRAGYPLMCEVEPEQE